jgi:hypothetical protein
MALILIVELEEVRAIGGVRTPVVCAMADDAMIAPRATAIERSLFAFI